MLTVQGAKSGLPLSEVRGCHKTLTYPCVVEVKYDGEYEWVIANDTGVYTMNKYGRMRTGMTATETLYPLLPSGTVLCAELTYADGKDFYDFMRHKLDGDLALVIFDVQSWGHEDMTKTKYSIRRMRLENELGTRLPSDGKVRLSEFDCADSWQEAELIAKTFIGQGYEGVVVKSVTGTLPSGANMTQAKVKKELTVDLRVGHKVSGKNAVELHDLTGKIGTVTMTVEAVEGVIVEVMCNGIIKTGSRLSLRHPRIKRVRRDKSVPDSLAEVNERREVVTYATT